MTKSSSLLLIYFVYYTILSFMFNCYFHIFMNISNFILVKILFQFVKVTVSVSSKSHFLCHIGFLSFCIMLRSLSCQIASSCLLKLPFSASFPFFVKLRFHFLLCQIPTLYLDWCPLSFVSVTHFLLRRIPIFSSVGFPFSDGSYLRFLCLPLTHSQ